MNTQENPFRWIEIYVKDMERAKKFYESVFQFKLEKIESPASMQNEVELWAFPMSKESLGASGALVKMKGFENNGCGVIPYFGSADCSIETKR
ncbi:MAG: VOC family protein, partial [Bdellovibrionales bacterium]|nr:VOC family protein [Bdellovibrionales bacterium]